MQQAEQHLQTAGANEATSHAASDIQKLVGAQVLKAEAANREALLARSRAYFMIGDLDMAKRHLGEVLSKIDPEDAAALADFRKIKKLSKLQTRVRSSCLTRFEIRIKYFGMPFEL